MILKRNRVMEAPVLLTNLRRNESVPNVEFCAGTLVKSRTRFGGLLAATVASSNAAVTVLLRWIGRREILRPGRAQTLAAARRRAVGIDEVEIRGVVIGVLGRADRARPQQ